MFSLHDGDTQVTREADGSVKVELDLCCNTVQTIRFSPAEWCSLVTSVAKDADTSETHEAVKAIHGAW